MNLLQCNDKNVQFEYCFTKALVKNINYAIILVDHLNDVKTTLKAISTKYFSLS